MQSRISRALVRLSDVMSRAATVFDTEPPRDREEGDLEALFTPVPNGPDYRWVGPTHECLCGENLFQIVAAFDARQVCFYLTEGLCWSCGAKVTVPTEIDPEIHTIEESA